MPFHLLRPWWQRALAVSVALALPLLSTHPVGAAGDPVSEAEARVTEARRAANDAAAEYDDAQTKYFTLEEEIERTRQQIATLEQQSATLTTVASERAIEAYKGGNSDLDTIMQGSDVLDAMRRSELLDRANQEGNDAVDQLGALTEDLDLQQASLDKQIAEQKDLVSRLEKREAEMRAALAAAEKAERELKERLERERREREYQARLEAARAAAAASAKAAAAASAAKAAASAPKSSGGGGGAAPVAPRGGGSVVVSGGFGCPVPGSSFSDSWGAARSGGRGHQGVDMMAGYGTPIYAAVSGTVSHSTSGLGGNQLYLRGNDGNTYFHAHLQSYVGGAGPVNAGDQIGTVGDTGNARGTPHLHFEIHPGGGSAVNPYPTVRAAC